MGRGRRTSGSKLVETMEGSRHAKRRLELILDTLAGRVTIVEACSALGINEAAFHKLRRRTLQESLDGLEPRLPGRRRQERSPEEERIEELEEELRFTRLELQAAQVREELALTMPHVLKKRKTTPK